MMREDWLEFFFLIGTNVFLRSPQRESLTRLAGFRKAEVSEIYQLFKQTLTKLPIDYSNFHNLDKTGFSAV